MFIKVLLAIISIYSILLTIFLFFRNKKPDGYIRINTIDPKKDLYTFEIEDLDILDKKRYITLEVKRDDNSYMSNWK